MQIVCILYIDNISAYDDFDTVNDIYLRPVGVDVASGAPIPGSPAGNDLGTCEF